MKEGWQIKILDELCEIFGRIGYRGYTKNDLVSTPEEGAITLSPTNIIDGELHYDKCSYITWEKYEESPEIMVFEGDIVLVKTASIGKCALVRKLPHKATLNPQFVVLKKIKANNQYLTYFLQSPIAQKKFQEYAIGTAIPTFSQKKLGTLEVPIPPLSEQQRIVSLLDAEFAKIDALKANAEKNLQNAKDLFQAALKKELEPKEGWNAKTLGDVCSIVNGGTPSTSVLSYWDGGVQWLTPKDMSGLTSKYVDKGERTISQKGVEHSSAKVLPAQSVILSSRAPIGYVAINIVPMATNQGCKGIVPMKEIQSEYLYYFLIKSNDLLNSLGTGATFKELSGGKLASITIPFPIRSEQQRIVIRLDSLNERCKTLQDNYTKTIALCDDLKQALLRKAFNGEI